MGRPAIEMVGKTFGEWTVLERAPAPEGCASPQIYWYKCRCSCGAIRIINGGELRRGRTKSCGHVRFLSHKVGEIINDYELIQLLPGEGKGRVAWKCKCIHCGQEIIIKETRLAYKSDTSCSCQEKIKVDDIFGALTILKILPHKPYEKQFYEVKCACGNIFLARRDHLLRGETKSCGCGAATLPYRRDLHNQVFGYAKVIEYDAKTSQEKGHSYWECKCLLCGKHFSILNTNLTRADRTPSCGEHNISYAEEEIKSLLNKYKIPYIFQYRNDKMRFQKTNRKMPFDFAILDKNGEVVFLLEYDGEQHFKEVNIWENRNNLAVRQQRDQEKEQKCQQLKIPLERISYKEKKHLNKELTVLLNKYNIAFTSPS